MRSAGSVPEHRTQHALDRGRLSRVDEEPAPKVRAKAIAIANALLAEGTDEGMAIRVGIARAKEWARHHLGLRV